MDDYLQYMKTLRSQMNGKRPSISRVSEENQLIVRYSNVCMHQYSDCFSGFKSTDVEDQAAKSSVEEQMLTSTIQTLENDLSLGLILSRSAS